MLHGILRLDGHPSVMMGFLKNIEGGTKPSDSKNELSLRTFLVMNETDGSVGLGGLVSIYFGLSFSSSSFFSGFFSVSVTKLTTGRLIDGSSYDRSDMVIKDLDLEPKVDDMMMDFLEQVLEMSPFFWERFSLKLLEHQDIIAEFCSPFRWKELSKGMSSKILPCGDDNIQ
nr:hypothetical protein [Tanacetum cinerariifolium]